MRTPKEWLDSMFPREVTPEYIAAIQSDARQGMVPNAHLEEAHKDRDDARKEAHKDRDDARKEAANTLVKLGKVEDQRDECLSLLRVLQPQVKMWLAGSSEYEWIGRLLEGKFGKGSYK